MIGKVIRFASTDLLVNFGTAVNRTLNVDTVIAWHQIAAGETAAGTGWDNVTMIVNARDTPAANVYFRLFSTQASFRLCCVSGFGLRFG